MARIDLDLAHAYKPNPQRDEDYALLPLKMVFEDGGAYALLGPSGCGKTTLLNIISGLVTPSQGSVRYDDRDVQLARGAEMGRFLLGSTVVLLFPPGPLAFSPTWAPGGAIRMGDAMARAGG
jgi:ABC-type lipoprotein export system ATPase subunit